MKTLARLLSIAFFNMLLAAPVSAEVSEQKSLNFKIRTEKLNGQDIMYFFTITTPREIVEKYPEIFELDSISLLQEPDDKIVLTKVSYIVNHPVGVFDHEHIKNEKFIAHFLGDKKIKPTENGFEVSGEENLKYNMRSYFDSDDITTLPNSRVTRAVATSKRLDVISGSASAVVFNELTNFSKSHKSHKGEVSVSAFIPLKENKTLIISYRLRALKKLQPDTHIKKSFLKEIQSVKDLTDSFKSF